MALQYSQTVLNARLDQVQTTTGSAPLLKIYTGAVPTNCATAATGTLLASFALPASWMNAASAGVKTKAGTWSGTGSAAGTAGYCRITDSTGTTVHVQGTAGIASGDFSFDNTSIAVSQVVTVNTFTLTAANV